MLAASSGARRGEILALRWSDIDLDRGRLSIERGIVRVGDELIEQGTKTHQSRRISLDAGTVAALSGHKARMIERAHEASRSHHVQELRFQSFHRLLVAVASGFDLPSLSEDLPAGWGQGRSPPRSATLRSDTAPLAGVECERSLVGWAIGIRARHSTSTHTSYLKPIKRQQMLLARSLRRLPTGLTLRERLHLV